MVFGQGLLLIWKLKIRDQFQNGGGGGGGGGGEERKKHNNPNKRQNINKTKTGLRSVFIDIKTLDEGISSRKRDLKTGVVFGHGVYYWHESFKSVIRFIIKKTKNTRSVLIDIKTLDEVISFRKRGLKTRWFSVRVYYWHKSFKLGIYFITKKQQQKTQVFGQCLLTSKL